MNSDALHGLLLAACSLGRRVDRGLMTAFTAFLIVAVGSGGCKKTRKMRCRIPAKTLEMLRSEKDDAEHSSERTVSSIQLMLKHCSGWPPGVKSYLKTQSASPEGRSVLLSRKTSRKELDRRLERLCPGLLKLFDRLGGIAPSERAAAVDKRCKIEPLKVMSRKEFRIDPITNVHALVVYQLLRKGGLDHRAARALGRQLMGRGHIGFVSKQGEIVLSPSSSRTMAVKATLLELSASSVRVEQMLVVALRASAIRALDKRDGPNGFLITPLFRRLKQVANRARTRAKSSGQQFAGHMVVAVHENMPYRTFAEVLYTARQAGFKRFQLLVRSRSLWDRVIIFDVVTSPASPQAWPRLRVTPSKLTLMLGGTSPPKVYPAQGDKRATSLQGLASFVHSRAAVLKAAGKWGVIQVEVDNALRFGDLVQVLDALRTKPGKRAGTCRFVFKPATSTWSLPSFARANCLLPYPKLRLVPPRPSAPATPPTKRP